MQMVADLLDTHRSMRQQPLGLHQNAFLDQLTSRFVQIRFADGIQIIGG